MSNNPQPTKKLEIVNPTYWMVVKDRQKTFQFISSILVGTTGLIWAYLHQDNIQISSTFYPPKLILDHPYLVLFFVGPFFTFMLSFIVFIHKPKLTSFISVVLPLCSFILGLPLITVIVAFYARAQKALSFGDLLLVKTRAFVVERKITVDEQKDLINSVLEKACVESSLSPSEIKNLISENAVALRTSFEHGSSTAQKKLGEIIAKTVEARHVVETKMENAPSPTLPAPLPGTIKNSTSGDLITAVLHSPYFATCCYSVVSVIIIFCGAHFLGALLNPVSQKDLVKNHEIQLEIVTLAQKAHHAAVIGQNNINDRTTAVLENNTSNTLVLNQQLDNLNTAFVEQAVLGNARGVALQEGLSSVSAAILAQHTDIQTVAAFGEATARTTTNLISHVNTSSETANHVRSNLLTHITSTSTRFQSIDSTNAELIAAVGILSAGAISASVSFEDQQETIRVLGIEIGKLQRAGAALELKVNHIWNIIAAATKK